MLACVLGFGICTIVFGLSRNLALSLGALAALGALDMVSVIIRHTVIQLGTPDEMRGRVSAVNMIFIGASNEVGQFESGLTAQWFGTVPAVVYGGIGTMVVVAAWAWMFPALRSVDRLPGQAPSRDRQGAEFQR
jgi:MFS family permease